MKEKILIVGAGGHARSVLDIALQKDEYDIFGCVAPCFPQRLSVEYFEVIPIVGTDDDLERIYQKGVKNVFVAIGDNRMRHELFEFTRKIGFNPVSIVSKHATISPRAMIGKGVCVMAGALINVNTEIGDNCIVNTNCAVDHDCSIGMSCHVAPGVTISGYTKIGIGTQLGTGSSVIDGVTIGEWSFIGAGAVVVGDLGSHVLAIGVPAKIVRCI